MESAALVFNFQRTSNSFTTLLKTSSTRSKGFHHHVVRNVSFRCHFSSDKSKFKPQAALCVRANSDKNVDGSGKHVEPTKYLDIRSTGACGSSSIEDLVRSSSYDVPKTSNHSSITNAGDDCEILGDNVLLDSNSKIAGSEPRVSSTVVSKGLTESNKVTVLSKQIWSSTSANASKTKSDPFSTTSSPQQSLSASRQRVLDALRQSEKDGRLTKFGQPVVPSNLFDEPKGSDSESFSFNFSPQQLLPVLSFFFISLVMFGTAFVVWKVGAIHYNEF